MELKILSSLELEDILETPRSMIQCEDAAEVQAKITLQQVVEWLEDRLDDYDVKQGGFSSDWFFIRITRSDWQQLKEVANESK